VEVGNLASRHEGANVKGLGGGHARFLEVLVSDDDVLALRVLIALHDLAPWNLHTFLAAESLVLNPGVVLLVQQIERQRFAALDGVIEVHRDGDEAEADGAFPYWAWHLRSLRTTKIDIGTPAGLAA